MTFLTKIHELLVKIGSFILQPLVLLVIRLYWGYQFVLTGSGKFQHLDKVAGFFASLGIPAAKLNATMAASTEVIGGSLLILGLFSRFAAVALTCVMGVALCTADHEATFNLFKDPDKFFQTDPFLFLYCAVIVLCFGPGKIALDTLVFREKKA
jgi:putative oxidoreductase